MNAEDKVLCKNEWLSLMQTTGEHPYTYATMSRTENSQLVACLVYKTADNKVTHLLGRYENTPCHGDGLALTSITGGVDKGSWHLPAVLTELIEEAGVPEEIAYGDVEQAMKDGADGLERLEYLGHAKLSKQEDTTVHLYAFDATGMDLNPSTSDGTIGEKDAYCKWLEPHYVLGCKCPLVAAIAIRSGIIFKI